MLKTILFAALVAGACAHGRGWFDRHGKEESDVKPPNCTCHSWFDKIQNDINSENATEGSHRHHWINKFLRENETTDQFFARKKSEKVICGTNNVTYANKCEFVNNASLNPSLGKQCHGPCPCKSEESERSHKHHFFKKWPRSICLNNGTTVYGWEEVKAASLVNPAIGYRCKGECSQCANDLKCPRRHDKSGKHHKRESTDVAPNCTCTLSDSPRFQKFLSSSCGKKFLEERQICGSNNITYANKCEYLNSKVKDNTLGKRCHGACPCDFEHLERNKTHNKTHEGWRKHSKPVCLNNGVTVTGWKEAKEILKANSSLGIRCKGECSQCQSGPVTCPFDWVKAKNEEEKARPKPPNCKCPKSAHGFMKKHSLHICGNDNATYANICDLINNQTTHPTLGFRCLGKCPCKNRTEDVEDADRMSKMLTDDTDEPESSDKSESEAGLDSEHENNLDQDSEASPSDDDQSDEAPLADANKQRNETESDEEGPSREKRNAGWGHRGWGKRHHRRHRFVVCLTNGQTVRGWRNVSAAFDADSTVGIRCKGHCDWCLNHTKCPRFPSEEKMQKIREHNKRKMFEWQQKFLAMTFESPNQPPNCSCADLFGAKGNESKKEFGHDKKWGHHGKFGMSLCGNNNVTYANHCDFINNQSVASGLGYRCHGKCPCSDEEFNHDDGHYNETESESFKKEAAKAGFKMVFCLTNGATVYKKRDLDQAMLSNLSLGVRCMNECSSCDAKLKCPRIFAPRNESDGKPSKFFGMGFFGGMKFGHKRGEWGHRKSENNETETEKKSFNETDVNDSNKPERYGWEKHLGSDSENETRSWDPAKFHSPSFQFGKAFDFGYDEMEEGRGWGHHGHRSWGHRSWGHRSWGHHGWGKEGRHHGWGHSCEEDEGKKEE